uniref:Active regulator of SIRT1 n=1 Tax=Caenorhabditis japonica TaxID=281687 RepID=A0A8R1I666_CAEJA
MSEELLQKFLKSIEQEDGITEVGKKKKKCKRVAERENVKTVLQAASKGHVQLSAEESYIVQKPSTSKGTDYIDDRLASQGFSLIDQARSYKPKDLKKRNLKYMKYQEGRRLDPKKGRVIVAAHMKTKADLKDLRKQKKVVVANAQTRMDANEEAQLYLQVSVKEPRRLLPGQKKKQKSKSVFSDADFAQVAHVAKRVNSMSDHSFL